MPLEVDPSHAGVVGTEFCREVGELAYDLAALLQRDRGLACELADWRSRNPEGSHPFCNSAAGSASAFVTASDEAVVASDRRHGTAPAGARSMRRLPEWTFALTLSTTVLTGCGGSGGASTLVPQPSAVPSPSAAPSPSPAPSPSAVPSPSANVATSFCIEIDDFTIPTSSQWAALVDLHASCVRFDAAPTWPIANYAPIVSGAQAHGLTVWAITPYVGTNEPNTHATYAEKAQFMASFATAYGASVLGYELMNEADNDGPLSETQLSVSQYLDYAETVGSAIRAVQPSAYFTTSGTFGLDLGWITAVLSIEPLVNCAAVHPYGVAPSSFAQSIVDVSATFGGKPTCITEWGSTPGRPESPADVSTAVAQSRGRTPVFVYYNLDSLMANPALYAAVKAAFQ